MPEKIIDNSGSYEYILNPKTDEATIVGISPILRGKVAIPEELDGHPVVSLGKGAFSTAAITGIVIPGSVRVVGCTTFYWCSELTEVIFSEGVEEIEDSAFAVCTKLARVSFPDSLRRIGALAFHRCNALSTIHFGRGLESIGDDAFAGCQRITSLELPALLSSLGEHVFLECSGLTRVTIPAGLTHLPPGTFFRCSALREIALPAALKSIGSRAFAGCSLLTSIHIPATVSDIGAYAFDGCSKLAEFTVELGNTAFRSSDGLLLSGDGTTLIRCPEGRKGKCLIPEGILAIARGAFERCARVRRISFPKSLAELHEHNFCDCKDLSDIDVPSANPAFKIQDGLLLSKDGKTLYYGIEDAKNINIPDGVERIEPSAFKCHARLRSITFPESITSIGDEAFAYCADLREAIFPDGLTTLPTRSFYGCTKLETIFLPDRIKTIGKQAFAACTNLSRVSIAPDATIGPWAFDACPWQPTPPTP